MKTIVRFAIGYVLGVLIVAAVLASRGDALEHAGRLLVSWLPISAGYCAVTIVVLKLAKITGSLGMLELCGLCIGLFPLISGLWPTYSMRWDLALIMIVVQCVALSAAVFIAYFFHRMIRSTGKASKAPPSEVK